jgi:hypothetical protein
VGERRGELLSEKKFPTPLKKPIVKKKIEILPDTEVSGNEV